MQLRFTHLNRINFRFGRMCKASCNARCMTTEYQKERKLYYGKL